MNSRPGSSATPRPASRAGFTLIELIVVSVLGALLLTATYNILITNQRTYQVQGVQVTSQAAMRQAIETLANEVRELSARDGDLLATDSDQLTIRVLQDFAIACDVGNVFLATPAIRVKKMSNWMDVGDSVYVFAEHQETLSTDDNWVTAAVTATDTTVTCNGSDQAQTLYFAGQFATFFNDTVRAGAPIRTFKRYEYSLVNWNYRIYLARRELPGGSATPMIGPFYDRSLGTSPSVSPITFTYYDANGSTTATPANVRRIDITVRTWSPVEDAKGQNVTDSITVSAYTRN